MNSASHNSIAERFGRWLGRGWRGYVHRERKVLQWLASKGLPWIAAFALLWAIKLVALGVLAYFSFWLALLMVFAVVARWPVGQSTSEDDFELGLPATLDGLREMPGYDPNLHNDTSHEMYRDDD
ncbi:DUF3742 family protein [Candidatus Symbiopectobacterium sp. NZEC135]|uniref:DUF3742 family protein n=1 Tax=Candidatus Symbiopectobacterium sp. NZEC135 TaxID=2820471 RepID=UPI0029CABE77|nr:DUF3742 family protein [Candidatus Symbiopectobacterium sp. NZEC135]MCW2478058.1 DUF3742 family protein [Candidatus Symbiopectobacterium sp. NZEC135]